MVMLIARIYQSASKGIDFVLAFLQADLDVDWYIPVPNRPYKGRIIIKK
jgi:hypothetical protein